MTIKEVIHNHNLDANRRYKDGSIIDAMVEYADYYAKKCLKIAAEQAIAEMSMMKGECWVDKDSILNIKLPDHAD